MATVEMTRMARNISQQKAMMKTILGGIYAIASEANLQLLVKSGQLTDRLTYDEAVNVPVTRRAWELALVLGLPHPAMICKRLAPCTSGTVEKNLIQAVEAIHRYYRMDLQRRMEDELQTHPIWFQLTKGPVPDIATDFGGQIGSGLGGQQFHELDRSFLTDAQSLWFIHPTAGIDGIYPVVKEHDGKTFLVSQVIKAPFPQDYSPRRELLSAPETEIDVATPGLNAVREWLAWRRNPQLLSPEFIPLVKTHAVNIAAGSMEPAQVSADAPPGLFGGRFDPHPVSPAGWLIDQGTGPSAKMNLPAKAAPPAPGGPWAGASKYDDWPGGVQQASVFGGGGGALLLVAGLAAWFILNRK